MVRYPRPYVQDGFGQAFVNPALVKKPAIRWGFLIGALLVVLVSAQFVAISIWDDGPRTASTSKRVHAVESLLGERGTEFLCGLVFLGVAIYLLVKALQRAGKTSRIVAIASIVLLFLAGLSAWAIPAFARDARIARQRDIVNQLQPLAAETPSQDVARLAFHQKVLVWDCTTDAPSPVQKLLPENRRAQSSEGPFTAVIVQRFNDETSGDYGNGRTGAWRHMTVAVVDYPEKTPQGIFQVDGEKPGFIVFQKNGDDGPIVGDTDKPLKEWIEQRAVRN